MIKKLKQSYYPSKIHECVASYFTVQIPILLLEKSDKNCCNAIRAEGSTIVDLIATRKEPDFSFTAKNAINGPTVVGEIAYHNENLEQLKKEANMWITGEHTQFFIGIKMSDNTRNLKKDPDLTCITWNKNDNKYTSIKFGNRSDCNGPNKINIILPIKCLFHSTNIPHPLNNNDILSIDLMNLREEIKQILT